MALSDLILPKGKVIVVLSSSITGIVPVDTALNFGTVQKVNDLCDVADIGDSVMFDVTKALPFMIISGTVFYMVDEKDISQGEIAAP